MQFMQCVLTRNYTLQYVRNIIFNVKMFNRTKALISSIYT